MTSSATKRQHAPAVPERIWFLERAPAEPVRRKLWLEVTDTELVRRIDRGRVAIVELNRPERRNALTGPLMDQLADHIEEVNAEAVNAAAARAERTSAETNTAGTDGPESGIAEPGVGALLLCGAGGAFCSGLDLKEYNAQPPPDWLRTAAHSIRRAHIALARCPVPVVVSLERYAINGGAAFALAGDLIVVGRHAWLQVGEVRQGMAAPMNIAWLSARYPLATVLQIVLRGHRLDGETMSRMNIATEVVDDDQVRTRAEELAAEVAAYPSGAAQSLKTAVLAMRPNLSTVVSNAVVSNADGHNVAAWFERAATLSSHGSEPLRPRSVQED